MRWGNVVLPTLVSHSLKKRKKLSLLFFLTTSAYTYILCVNKFKALFSVLWVGCCSTTPWILFFLFFSLRTKGAFFLVNMERMRRWTFRKKHFFLSQLAHTKQEERNFWIEEEGWENVYGWFDISSCFVKSIVQYRSSDNPFRIFWRDRKGNFKRTIEFLLKS